MMTKIDVWPGLNRSPSRTRTEIHLGKTEMRKWGIEGDRRGECERERRGKVGGEEVVKKKKEKKKKIQKRKRARVPVITKPSAQALESFEKDALKGRSRRR
ncbi:hypothetical protein RUM44_007860 [Polyplax serrata]|uniref:Uncharacterized protein n=1 Tax=Polyplax serrata TaxID=468196 RepID=A0ABR1B7C0_POLSC